MRRSYDSTIQLFINIKDTTFLPGHTTRTGQMTDVYNIVVGKTEETHHFKDKTTDGGMIL
jgi:hypothetical protein